MVWALAVGLACSSPDPGVEAGLQVPELPNAASVGRGAFEGERSVLLFWASWSGSSRQLGPQLAEWREAEPSHQLLAVNVGEERGMAEAAAARWLPAVSPVRTPPEGISAWLVDTVPTVVLVDEHAIVRYRGATLPSPESFSWEDR